MTAPLRITEALLHAYADGKLAPRERALVEQHLRSDPALAAQVADWRKQNEALSALFAPVGGVTPARLDPRRIAASSRRQAAGHWRQLAAAVVILGLGLGVGWAGRGMLGAPTPATLVGEAVDAHLLYTREMRHAVEVPADEEVHLQAWLSKRLDRPLDIPDLSASGFRLLGGRLLPAATGPAAQFMYENSTAQRVTLYVITGVRGEEQPLQLAALEGVDAVTWSEEGISCALVGTLDRGSLQTLAKLAYQQLES